MSGDIILALDTATDRLSVAALRLRVGDTPTATDAGDGAAQEVDVLAECGEVSGRATSRRLLPVIEHALETAAVLVDALGAIVVGVGPGTFTGVRIAVATARALGLALDVPVLGVPTLAALAAQGAAALHPCGDSVDALVPVVDARRGQVFAGVYRRGAGDRWVRGEAYRAVTFEALAGHITSACSRSEVAAPVLLGEASLLAQAGQSGFWAGARALDIRAAALVCGQERLDEPGDAAFGARIVPALGRMLGGDWAAAGSAGRAPGVLGTPESVVPLYVRAPDADEHITRMRDPFAA